jgi:hypothetical protein
MNNALPSAQADDAPQNGGATRRTDRMFSELLALNEQMIVQLRMECASTGRTTDFLSGMIRQHEQAAKRLRTQLRKHNAAFSREGSDPAPATSFSRPVTC